MFPQDAVLHDDVVVAVVEPGLLEVLVNKSFPVIWEKFADVGVAGGGSAAVSVNHGCVAGGHRAGTQSGVNVNLTFIQHHVQRLVRSQPVMFHPSGTGVVQTQSAAVAELYGPAVVPGVVAGFDTIEVLQRRPEP